MQGFSGGGGGAAQTPKEDMGVCMTVLSASLSLQGFQGKTGPPGPPGVVGPQVSKF